MSNLAITQIDGIPATENISNEKISHVIWCALMSLYLHKQECGKMTHDSENFYLMRWYSRSMKKQSFSKKYADTLHFLAQNWQESGLSNQLHQYLLHMWIACI